MFQFIIYWHFFVIYSERSSFNAPLILLGWMGAKFTCEHIENLLADPSSFRERREGEIVWIHFP